MVLGNYKEIYIYLWSGLGGSWWTINLFAQIVMGTEKICADSVVQPLTIKIHRLGSRNWDEVWPSKFRLNYDNALLNQLGPSP